MSELIKTEHINKWLPVRQKAKPNLFSKFVHRALKFDKVNELYNENYNKKGIDFIRNILTELHIKYSVDKTEINNIPRKGGCILVSNHPFGGLEGLILFDLLHEKRPDIKVLANFLLENIEPIREYFISVNPLEYIKNYKNLKGVKEAYKHVKNGGCLLIFPAGQVSSAQLNSMKIVDSKWEKGSIKFIKNCRVPIIPIYFSGCNSLTFQLLGLINPVLRTIKLPSELLNKSNELISLRIGTAISVAEQEKFNNINSFGRYLRARTYTLAYYFNISKFYTKYVDSSEPIVDQIDTDIILKEIESLTQQDKLFEQNQYEIYCTTSEKIPNIITEIGRLRELTFREVGEGTNAKIDLDEFDYYYYHLFIWDKSKKRIVGAYRLGLGDQIIEQYGIKGFYTSTLFKYKKSIRDVLIKGIELGRSFIVSEYQKSSVALFLLWKGIFLFLKNNSQYKYLFGPVSISKQYTEKSKSILVKYIINNHFDYELAKLVKARKAFRPKIIASNDNIILHSINTLDELDNIIYDIEKQKIPVLLRKYLMLNGKIISFNIDPAFNHVLDGLLLLDVEKVPQAIIQQFEKQS